MATQAKRIIEEAVIRKDAKVGDKLLDKAFALAFKGLVYAQIWEDPVVDMEGLDIRPDSRLMSIASGSCNALSYLTANPESVTAVRARIHWLRGLDPTLGGDATGPAIESLLRSLPDR